MNLTHLHHSYSTIYVHQNGCVLNPFPSPCKLPEIWQIITTTPWKLHRSKDTHVHSRDLIPKYCSYLLNNCIPRKFSGFSLESYSVLEGKRHLLSSRGGVVGSRTATAFSFSTTLWLFLLPLVGTPAAFLSFLASYSSLVLYLFQFQTLKTVFWRRQIRETLK